MAVEGPGDFARKAEDVVRLEYSCTAAERSEAQSLLTRDQLGGGSRWRAGIMLAVILVGVFLGLWMKMRQVVPAAYHPHFVGGVVVLFIGTFIWNRRRAAKAETPAPITVELSAEGLRIVADQAQAAAPWSALSRRLESDSLLLFQDRTGSVSYIIPKRVLPNDDCLQWLREIDLGESLIADSDFRPDLAADPPPLGAGDDPSDVTLHFQLGFWNCIDRALASWASARGIAVVWIAMNFAVAAYAAFEPPPPDAKFTAGDTFCYFVLPAALIGATVLATFASLYSWLQLRKHLAPQSVRLGDTGLTLASRDGTATLPWTTYTRYKETWGGFLMWNIATGNWLMLPRSAFPSTGSIDRCRELLASHLRRSTWFFG